MAIKKLHTSLEKDLSVGFVWYKNNATALISTVQGESPVKLLLPNILLTQYPWYSASYTGFIDIPNIDMLSGCTINDIIAVWQMRMFGRPFNEKVFNRVKRFLNSHFDDHDAPEHDFNQFKRLPFTIVRHRCIEAHPLVTNVESIYERNVTELVDIDTKKIFELNRNGALSHIFRIRKIRRKSFSDLSKLKKREARTPTKPNGTINNVQEIQTSSLLTLSNDHMAENIGVVIEMYATKDNRLTLERSWVLNCSHQSRSFETGPLEAEKFHIGTQELTADDYWRTVKYIENNQMQTQQLSENLGLNNRFIFHQDLFALTNFANERAIRDDLDDVIEVLNHDASFIHDGYITDRQATQTIILTKTIETNQLAGAIVKSPILAILRDGEDAESVIEELESRTQLSPRYLNERKTRRFFSENALVECNAVPISSSDPSPRFTALWDSDANRLRRVVFLDH